MIQLIHGECLAEMAKLPDQSVDMVMCDLPYGTTSCKWDHVIDPAEMWKQYKRLCRGSIVLTAAQPFTSVLVTSNIQDLRDEWIWAKNAGTNFANAKRQPLREHESVLVFCKGIYNPQMRPRLNERAVLAKRVPAHGSTTNGGGHGFGTKPQVVQYDPELRNPGTVIAFDVVPNAGGGKLHPTQKPVALMEYLIKTYTNEGMTVLDNCMGSGTTGVACVNTGRSFIGIEQDAKYFEIAKGRIEPSVHFLDEEFGFGQTEEVSAYETNSCMGR